MGGGDVFPIKIEDITPEKAKEYLATNLDSQRKWSNVSIKRYAELMIKGEWRVNPSEPISFDKNGKLINGQNRLRAVIRAGITVRMAVLRGAEEEDFKVIDTGKNRTIRDIFTIEKIYNSSATVTVISGYLALCANIKGGGDVKFHTSNRCFSADDFLEFYKRREEILQDIVFFARRRYSEAKYIPVSDSGAIMLYLHEEKDYDLDFIKAFFTQLTDGGEKCRAIRDLRQMLQKDMVAIRYQKYTKNARMVLIAKAWSFYSNGRNNTKLVLYQTEKLKDFL